MTARAPSPPTGPWIWADDLVAWIAAQTLGMALAAARDELNAAWRGGRIEAFHGRSDRKEPKPVPPEASAHPTAAIRPGNRIVGASAMVPVRRAGELIQQVLLAEVSFAGVRFSRIEALALWPEAEEAAERTKQEVEAQAVSEAIEHTLEAAEQAERDRVTAIAKAAADAKEAAEKAERNRIAAEKTAALAGNGNEGKQPARAKLPERPSQEAVNKYMLGHYQAARDRGDPPPKGELEAFPACHKETGARHAQMEEAMRHVSAELKRRRGNPGT
jgi:hypothetical protein